MRHARYGIGLLVAVGTILAWGSTLLVGHTHADQATQGNFNLQVTPSPLVTTVKPGTRTQLELKIHNGSTGSEDLKIEPRAFSLSQDSTNVTLLDTTPPDIGSWITFSRPRFSMQPGEWTTELITLNVPKDAGFSYNFALVISRQNTPVPTGGTRAIAGSVAIFTLINVDRPGATSNLGVSSFSISKHIYEYLPATLSVRFRNGGNTIVQPFGNIFIQRSSNDKTPLSSLNVNESKGYILPGTERTITATWDDGFPVFQASHNADGSTSQKLVWNWTKVASLRIGHYTAHLVAVYSQNGRDVPIEGTVSFWVIPWKILLALLAVVLLVLFALFMLVRMILRSIKRSRAKRAARNTAKAEAKSDDTGAEKTS